MQEKRYIVEGQDTLLPFLMAHVAGKAAVRPVSS